MALLNQKSAILRSNSSTQRDAFLNAIRAWLARQEDDEVKLYAQFLDLKNLEKLFTIVFSNDALATFDIPEEMAEIDIVGLIVDIVMSKVRDELEAALANNTNSSIDLTPLENRLNHAENTIDGINYDLRAHIDDDERHIQTTVLSDENLAPDLSPIETRLDDVENIINAVKNDLTIVQDSLHSHAGNIEKHTPPTTTYVSQDITDQLERLIDTALEPLASRLKELGQRPVTQYGQSWLPQIPDLPSSNNSSDSITANNKSIPSFNEIISPPTTLTPNISIKPILGLGVADEKHTAILEATLELINERPAQSYAFRHDLSLVEPEKLPALIAESSLEEYIEPGLSETHIRRLLARNYELKALKGLVIGSKFGLELLGMTCDWKQWFETEPMGQPGTHEVTVFVNEQIFDDALMLISERVQAQALRMIENTKRKSQHIAFRIGLVSQTNIGLSASAFSIHSHRAEAILNTDATLPAGIHASAFSVHSKDVEAVIDTDGSLPIGIHASAFSHHSHKAQAILDPNGRLPFGFHVSAFSKHTITAEITA